MHTFNEHKSVVTSIAMDKDASFIVSGSKDCSMKVWSLQKGKERCLQTIVSPVFLKKRFHIRTLLYPSSQ